MASRCAPSTGLFLPFLYPSLFRSKASRISIGRFARSIRPLHSDSNLSHTTVYDATSVDIDSGASSNSGDDTATATTTPHLHSSTDPSSSSAELPTSRLNPAPDDYSISTFADKARVTVHAGGGGHGCVSFLREMFLAEGPANGGDGGHGGSVYIQAVAHGETSLHRLARGPRALRAGRGKSGMGDARGGARGDDLLIKVPVGTVVRELERQDPVADEQAAYHAARKQKREYERLVQEAEEAAAAQARAESENENGGAGGEGDEEDGFSGRGSRRRADEKEKKKKTKKRSTDGEDDGEGFTSSTLEASEAAARAALGLPDAPEHPNLHKFILYPGMSPGERSSLTLPRYPRRERLLAQPEAPIRLDLTTPTARPILLAAGGLGGLGNPHFVSKDRPRPLFATRGEGAVSVTLELELKLLADVGLVGLPNAGKSTLLRALTRSRARVGNWAFTTLQPNIGTVVLDNHKGRPVVPPPAASKPSSSFSRSPSSRFGSVVVTSSGSGSGGQHHIVSSDDVAATAAGPRTRFTVADIPGLIEGAHLDRGLGVAFLRHVERAGVLAFVVDLGAGDAVAALKALWAEVGLYARMREEEENEREIADRIDWEGNGNASNGLGIHDGVVSTSGMDGFSAGRIGSAKGKGGRKLDIAAKPWFVVATKGDLPSVQDNYARLREYLNAVTDGREPHPSGVESAWTENCAAIPVSAIHGQGVDRILHWVVGLLD